MKKNLKFKLLQGAQQLNKSEIKAIKGGSDSDSIGIDDVDVSITNSGDAIIIVDGNIM